MPRSYELMTTLRAAGYAAVISGAGPTVLVLGTVAQLAGLEEVPAPGFSLRRCGVGTGAQLGESEPLREYRAGVLAFYSRTRSADRGGRLVRVITSPGSPRR